MEQVQIKTSVQVQQNCLYKISGTTRLLKAETEQACRKETVSQPQVENSIYFYFRTYYSLGITPRFEYPEILKLKT